MNALLALLLLAGAGQTTPASTPAPSPLLGSWAVDLERLPIPPEARPKSVTITYSDVGGGKWRTNVDIINGDGTESHGVSTYTADGTPAPAEGTLEADISAVKLPAPNVMVLVLGKDGKGASTRVYTVAPDGRTMVETATYYAQDGKPVIRTNWFKRVR